MAALRRTEDDLRNTDGTEEPGRVFFFAEASLAHETACTLRDHHQVTWFFSEGSPYDVALRARSPRDDPGWPRTGTFVQYNHRRPARLAVSFPGCCESTDSTSM